MLQVFQADVAKADLDVALLHFVASVLSECCQCLSGCCQCLSGCCAFNERFKCPMQHETDVAAVFFLISNGWLTILLNIFLML